MNEEDTKDILIAHQIEQSLKKLHNEIDFASKILNVKSDEYGDTLNSCISSFKSLLEKLEDVLEQSKSQKQMIIDEIAILTLLPEKITNNIKQIIPQIASEIEQIHQPHVLEIKEQFTILHNNLTTDIMSYKNQLDGMASSCTEQLNSAAETFSTTLEQKLNQFTDKLTKSAGLASAQNSKMLIKNLAFVVIFSAVISGITSYVVTTKFPRFVRITGANNLSVHDSKVEVWNSKKELEVKEPKFKKTK